MVVYPNAHSLKRQCKPWLFLIPETLTLQPGSFSMFSVKHLTVFILKHLNLDKHFCRPNILAVICSNHAAYSDYSYGALENQLVMGILLDVWRCVICGEGQTSHGSEQMVVITCANMQLHLITTEVLRQIFHWALHIYLPSKVSK